MSMGFEGHWRDARAPAVGYMSTGLEGHWRDTRAPSSGDTTSTKKKMKFDLKLIWAYSDNLKLFFKPGTMKFLFLNLFSYGFNWSIQFFVISGPWPQSPRL